MPTSPAGGSGPDQATAAEVAAELATIDAADAEIVLRRAIELGEPAVEVEQFPVAGLEQVAAELHVPVSAVAAALAEYRAGGLVGDSPDRARGVVERLVGPAQVTVRSRTGLSEEEAAARLGEWLKRHRLRIRTNAEGTVVAIRRRGLLPTAMRQIRGAAGAAGLSGLREVRGAAVSAGEGQTMLCIVADVGEQRTQSVVAGSAVALGGSAVVATTAAVVAAPVTLVGVPVFVGAGWVITRVTHGRQVRRVREEMEMTTDNVAAGARPSGRLQEIAERMGSRRS